jgi:hypothetical protein
MGQVLDEPSLAMLRQLQRSTISHVTKLPSEMIMLSSAWKKSMLLEDRTSYLEFCLKDEVANKDFHINGHSFLFKKADGRKQLLLVFVVRRLLDSYLREQEVGAEEGTLLGVSYKEGLSKEDYTTLLDGIGGAVDGAVDCLHGGAFDDLIIPHTLEAHLDDKIVLRKALFTAKVGVLGEEDLRPIAVAMMDGYLSTFNKILAESCKDYDSEEEKEENRAAVGVDVGFKVLEGSINDDAVWV